MLGAKSNLDVEGVVDVRHNAGSGGEEEGRAIVGAMGLCTLDLAVAPHGINPSLDKLRGRSHVLGKRFTERLVPKMCSNGL